MLIPPLIYSIFIVYEFGTKCPSAKGIIHLGATSCYVTDNAEVILMSKALEIIKEKLLLVIANLIERKTRKGKIFYGCDNFPKCKTAFWDKPLDEKCPNCGKILLETNDKIKCSECEYEKDK